MSPVIDVCTLAALPPELARVDRAIFTYVRAMFDEREAAVPERDGHASSHAAAVRGLAVNAGQYEGPARVLSGPGELDRIQRGDVLVTASTSAAFNVALPLVGAIVTDRGGLLCHAAIVARALGIPAVVGCRAATRRLRDGARIRVDGGTGEARVVA